MNLINLGDHSWVGFILQWKFTIVFVFNVLN